FLIRLAHTLLHYNPATQIGKISRRSAATASKASYLFHQAIKQSFDIALRIRYQCQSFQSAAEIRLYRQYFIKVFFSITEITIVSSGPGQIVFKHEGFAIPLLCIQETLNGFGILFLFAI